MKEFEKVSAAVDELTEGDKGATPGDVIEQLVREKVELQKNVNWCAYHAEVVGVATQGRAFQIGDIAALRSSVASGFQSSLAKYSISAEKALQPFHLNLLYHDAKDAVSVSVDRSSFDDAKKQNISAHKLVKTNLGDLTKDSANIIKRCAALTDKLGLAKQIGAIAGPQGRRHRRHQTPPRSLRGKLAGKRRHPQSWPSSPTKVSCQLTSGCWSSLTRNPSMRSPTRLTCQSRSWCEVSKILPSNVARMKCYGVP